MEEFKVCLDDCVRRDESILEALCLFGESLTPEHIEVILSHPSYYLTSPPTHHAGHSYRHLNYVNEAQMEQLLLDPRSKEWGRESSLVNYTVYDTALEYVTRYPELLKKMMKDPRCLPEYKARAIRAAVYDNQREALRILLTDKDLREHLKKVRSPYENGELCELAINFDCNRGCQHKLELLYPIFNDKDFEYNSWMWDLADHHRQWYIGDRWVPEKKIYNMLNSRAIEKSGDFDSL